jgi:hypothetical protein
MPFRVHTVHRLVEQQDIRVAEQRTRYPDPLHSYGRKSHLVEHLGHPTPAMPLLRAKHRR